MSNHEAPTNIIWDEHRGWIDLITLDNVTHLPTNHPTMQGDNQ